MRATICDCIIMAGNSGVAEKMYRLTETSRKKLSKNKHQKMRNNDGLLR